MKTEMQKEIIIQKLRDSGCRITRQRQILLDVILQEDCDCCKEIYYKAAAIDSGIGAATVYRMINLLEEIGAIDRKNMYRIACCEHCVETMEEERYSRRMIRSANSAGQRSIIMRSLSVLPVHWMPKTPIRQDIPSVSATWHCGCVNCWG